MSQCSKIKTNGKQCKNKTPTLWKYCSVHMPREENLLVKESPYLQNTLSAKGIPPHPSMKGLFAYAPHLPPNDIVFTKGQHICDYGGETISRQDHDARLYLQPNSTITSPYATTGLTRNTLVNASCERGLGSMINHCTDRRQNCSLKIHPKEGTVWIHADRDIKNNTELLINYNKGLRRGAGRYSFTNHKHTTR